MNFNGTDSHVILGKYNNSDYELFVKMVSGFSQNWALDVYSVSFGSSSMSSFTNPAAVFASEYPYIALPSDLWTVVKSQLTAAGFVCFDSAFKEHTHC